MAVALTAITEANGVAPGVSIMTGSLAFSGTTGTDLAAIGDCKVIIIGK